MKYNPIIKFFYTLIFIIILLFSELILIGASIPEVIVQQKDSIQANTEALLILPGFGDSRRGRKHQKKFFSNNGYDLFIPDFADRKTIDQSMENLKKFYDQQNLEQYEKVHVFSYIMGSWVINQFINKYGIQNISSIVYDRSPLQERAPAVVTKRIKLIGFIMVGPVIEDLSKIDYPPIDNDSIAIGIIVECKATPLIKFFKKTTLKYGEIDWKNHDYMQVYDDLMYTYLHHDQMYKRFDVIGYDILSFISTGKFSKQVKREPYLEDPFKKHKAN